MGKRMKLLPFLSKAAVAEPKPHWPWPAYCQQPRTLSFRDIDTTQKTLLELEEAGTRELGLEVIDPVEEVIKDLRSERLFFEPEETSSILEEANNKLVISHGATTAGTGAVAVVPFKESVAMSIESHDPYLDFKKSMEEMVEAHGLRGSWEELQELLCCYLRVNGKGNHGYILGAFVDLLVGYAFASSSSSCFSSGSTYKTNTCSSSYTSSSSGIRARNTSRSNECPCSCSRSPSSPLSFYTSSSCSASSSSSSSSYECSSTSNPCVSSSSVLESEESDINNIIPCLSSSEVEDTMDES